MPLEYHYDILHQTNLTTGFTLAGNDMFFEHQVHHDPFYLRRKYMVIDKGTIVIEMSRFIIAIRSDRTIPLDYIHQIS